MKQKFSFAICIAALALWSCNNSSSEGTANDTTTNSNATASDTSSTSNANNNTAAANTPLSKDDSTFVMEAAVGGMMEVEAGNQAQQSATNQRVKDFGSMMVTDHSKANDELKNLASSHGMTLPTSLPADKQKHLNDMKKLKGKSFDQHYIDMMVTDHKKDIDKFKQAAEKCNDTQLKTWASTTLPTLQKHMDSVNAIKKAM
jgi:putative membrane protein